MHVNCQFIIIAIIYSGCIILAIESANCDCDVLEVKSNGKIGYQNFTKQIVTLHDKPFYFSKNKHVIYWDNRHWSYSHLFNKSGGWNKRGGGVQVAKSINQYVNAINKEWRVE